MNHCKISTFVTALLIVSNVQAAPWDRRKAQGSSNSKQAETASESRTQRRMGIGTSVAGPLGLVGVNLELNISEKFGFLTGFGGGPGYQAFTLQVKRTLGGESFLPYLAAGYSRWYTPGTSTMDTKETTPSLITEKLMNDEDRRTGRLNKNLLFPSIGVQYLQTDGDWAGYSIFAEFVVLLDINDFVAAPTGTIGLFYYF